MNKNNGNNTPFKAEDVNWDELAAIGEVGLTGELRTVNALDQRLAEVHRLGFTQCMLPARNSRKLPELPGLRLIPVKNIREALDLLRNGI